MPTDMINPDPAPTRETRSDAPDDTTQPDGDASKMHDVSVNPEPDDERLTEMDYAAMVGMVMELFTHWQVDPAHQAVLLGLPAGNVTVLDRLRTGESSNVNSDVKERMGHLLAIHHRLRELFPGNRELVYSWMATPNAAFENRAPLALVNELGLAGLLAVRSYLASAMES